MEDKYIICVTGKQTVDSDTDTIEVTTTGDFMLKNGHWYIKYKEYDSEDPTISNNAVVKVESDNKVAIIRTGDRPSRLVLEKGVRHQCHYRTAMGDLMIGVYASDIESDLSKSGGELKVKYQLDFYSNPVSDNEIHIKVKEKEE